MANGQLTRAIRHIRGILSASAGNSRNDRELLERFAATRDEAAFTALVRRHGPVVFGVCRRVLDNEADAEDAFQATFLVLARKARSVQWHESIGNWLYGVAHRIATRVRMKDTIRRRHEQQASTMMRDESSGTDWHELRRLLDDELMRLPAKYRMPLLLCYLHGKTRDEAAEELGWTSGMVKGCLERGRELLRSRLSRRGLTLSAALLPPLLAEGVVTAVPVAWVSGTVLAATHETIAASVAELVKGAIQAMFWNKVKIVGLLVVLVVVGTAAAVSFLGAPAGGEQPGADAARPDGTELKLRPEAEDVAWGDPLNGVRLGLAPRVVRVSEKDNSFRVKVWYENVGREPRDVPEHKDQNKYRLMFAAVKAGTKSYVDYRVDRLGLTAGKFKKLKPGERFQEEFTLTFGAEMHLVGLPDLGLGESLTLRAGLAARGDTKGQTSWLAADTLRSESITVTRVRELAGASARDANATEKFLGPADQRSRAILTAEARDPLRGGPVVYLEGSGACVVRLFGTALEKTEKRFHVQLTPAEAQALIQLAVDADLVALQIKQRPAVPGNYNQHLRLNNAAGQTHSLSRITGSDPVPEFDKVIASVIDLRKKVLDGAKPDYDGAVQPNWKPFESKKPD